MVGRALVLTVLALALLTSTAGAQLPTVTMTATQGGSTGLALYVVKLLKLDEKNGVNLDLKYMAPAAGNQALVLGRVDVGFIDPFTAVRANTQQKKKIRIFAPMLSSPVGIVVRKDSPYQTLDDLKGQKVGMVPKASSSYLNLAVLLKMRGIDIDKAFQVVNGEPATLVGLMQRRDLEAIVPNDPAGATLVASGQYRFIGHVRDLWKQATGRTLPALGMAALESWLEPNADTARRIAKSYNEAIDALRQQPELFQQEAIQKVLGVKSAEEAAFIRPYVLAMYYTDWADANVADAGFYVAKGVEHGFLEPNPPDVFVKRLTR